MGLQYTWGAATDDLVAIRDTQGHHYYATTDRLGSVRTLARRDGTWQLTQRFDPHGRPLARDTAASFGLGARLRYGWTGREWDAETGFSYHRARYFDPTSRRWTQEDPIGYGGGGNLYAYAGGSPLEARDPSGLMADNSAGDTRGFMPFCTMAGSCIDAMGAVTSDDRQFSIEGVAIGSGGSGAWALGLVASGMGTITQAQSLADQVWAAQEVSRLRKQTLSKCVAYSCPGSMRMTEYGKVLNAVDAITYVPTQVGILRLLIAGRVHATNNPIQGAHGITEWGTADIVITRNYQNRRESVFNRTRGELAYVLAHEYHHNRALEGTTRAWREGNRHLYQPNDGATSPWEAAFESAADAFACTVTDAGSRGRFEHGCAP